MNNLISIVIPTKNFWETENWWETEEWQERLKLTLLSPTQRSEVRKKIGLSKLGNTYGRALKGRKLSEEHRRNISLAKAGHGLGVNGKYIRSKEIRKKISESLKGRHQPEETKQKIGLALKGKPTWTKGIHLSEEHRRKIGDSHRGVPLSANHMKAMLLATRKRPTLPEQRLEALLKYCCPDQYKYTGDGSVIFSGISPDFINCNGQKKVIEVFGDYWHSKLVTGREPQEEMQNRKDKFAAFGFDCLIIWEKELRIIIWGKEISKEELVPLVNKILTFESKIIC